MLLLVRAAQPRGWALVPGQCGNYGAMAAYWITTPMRGQIEATVYAELKQWLDKMFPWQPIYFPGGPDMSDDVRASRYQMMERGICL